MDDFKVTFDGTDITEYVNRPDVQKRLNAINAMNAIDDMGYIKGEVFTVDGSRPLTDDELAEIARLWGLTEGSDE